MAGGRLRYTEPTFTLPVSCAKNMTELEYALRVGNITKAEYDAATTLQKPSLSK